MCPWERGRKWKIHHCSESKFDRSWKFLKIIYRGLGKWRVIMNLHGSANKSSGPNLFHKLTHFLFLLSRRHSLSEFINKLGTAFLQTANFHWRASKRAPWRNVGIWLGKLCMNLINYNTRKYPSFSARRRDIQNVYAPWRVPIASKVSNKKTAGHQAHELTSSSISSGSGIGPSFSTARAYGI